MIRQALGYEKRVTNHIYNKGLISRIYKKASKLNNNNNKIVELRNAQETQRHFNKEDIQIAHKHVK